MSLAGVVLRCIRPLAAPSRRRHHAHLNPRLQFQPRHLTTPPPMLASTDISMATYQTISDETMDMLLESLEVLVDSVPDKRYEVEYSSGVLTLTLGDKGTYVINKQPPNKQIWLSSPFSGPKRYDFSEARNVWFYSRDGKTLGTLLKEELKATFNKDVDVGVS